MQYGKRTSPTFMKFVVPRPTNSACGQNLLIFLYCVRGILRLLSCQSQSDLGLLVILEIRPPFWGKIQDIWSRTIEVTVCEVTPGDYPDNARNSCESKCLFGGRVSLLVLTLNIS